MKGTHLFIIDPQNDFCKQGGSLFVTGADKDMSRLAKMLNKNIKQIKSITVTLDSHNDVHIAHPVFTVDANGNRPAPYTLISHDDVATGKYRGYRPDWTKILLDYTEKLEKTGKYKLMVWPPHCLIGTPGHCVVDELNESFRQWTLTKGRNVDFVTKGSNPYTEHYGAVKAEVEQDDDASTKLNENLIKLLMNTGDDDILIAGEALSHCVANTIRQVAEQFTPDQIKKFVLLTDACSNVTGFESLGDAFVTEMTAKGMRLTTTDTYFK